MLVTKQAPGFKATAVMPDNSFEEISLSDYKGKKVGSGTIIWEARRMHARGEINYEEFIFLGYHYEPL